MEILSLSVRPCQWDYSYADYLVWKIKERVELLKGKIFEMSAFHKREKAKYIL